MWARRLIAGVLPAAVMVLVVTVHPSVPAKSVRELIALAKARPGELNYASTATGGTPHLAAELFKSMARVNIRHLPYKGAGAAMIDVMAGEVQLIFAVPNAIVGPGKTGRLRALAVTSSEPSVLLPGIPTVAATGLPGCEFVAQDPENPPWSASSGWA